MEVSSSYPNPLIFPSSLTYSQIPLPHPSSSFLLYPSYPFSVPTYNLLFRHATCEHPLLTRGLDLHLTSDLLPWLRSWPNQGPLWSFCGNHGPSQHCCGVTSQSCFSFPNPGTMAHSWCAFRFMASEQREHNILQQSEHSQETTWTKWQSDWYTMMQKDDVLGAPETGSDSMSFSNNDQESITLPPGGHTGAVQSEDLDLAEAALREYMDIMEALESGTGSEIIQEGGGPCTHFKCE